MCGTFHRKFLYHAVHMIFSSMFDEAEMDPNEKRESKLVFIGKNLDAEELKRFLSVACTLQSLSKFDLNN